MIQEQDELVDIVDEHDQPVRTMWRSQAIKDKVPYTRVVIGMIRHIDGSFCYLRRTPHKTHPNALAPAGGGVQSGESYWDALVRELQEEINIDIRNHAVRELGLLHPRDSGLPIFRMSYEVTIDTKNVTFNPHDFSEAVWLTHAQLIARVHAGEKVISDLIRRVEHFYPELV